MALGTGVTGSGFIASAGATIPTAAFTPSAGSRLCGIVRWLPETNAVVTAVADAEGLGNTYALDGSATTDANGYKCHRYVSTNNLSLSGSMVVTATLVGGATNNAEGGSFIVAQEVTDTGGAESAGSGTGGQAQSISSITTDNATTGACGTPTAANGLVVAFFTHNVEFDTHAAGTGYTQVAEDTTASRSWFIEKLQQTSAAAVTATMSVGANGSMNNHAFTMKANTGPVTKTDADTGTGTEIARPTIAVTIAAPRDTATAADQTVPITATLVQRDTAVAAEGSSVDTGSAVQKTGTDSAAAIDSAFIAATIAPRDTASLTEGVPNVSPHIPTPIPVASSDSGTAAEYATVTVGATNILSSDTAATNENTTQLDTLDPTMDFTATDRLVTLTAAVTGRDTASAGEAASIVALVTAPRDTASPSEASQITQSGGANPVDSDMAVALEVASIIVVTVSADSGSGIEVTTPTVLFEQADSAAMADAIDTLLASLTSADSAQWLEAASVLFDGGGPSGVLTARVSITARVTGSVSFEPTG